jgi:histidinol dehydrogenase
MKIYYSENTDELLHMLRKRSSAQQPKIVESVSCILEEVRKNGDRALFEFTRKFDGMTDETYL